MPEKPGVYIFRDRGGRVIYIGKSTCLRKRVASYFRGRATSLKVDILSKNTASIDFIVTNNEQEALILENNLIKEHKPRYNIQWRDDKTYPWLVLTKEPFPRLIYRRRLKGDEDVVVGPLPSTGAIKHVINTFRRLFLIRNCNLPLTTKNVLSGKYRPCIEWHIGMCGAPCCAYQSHEDYIKNIEEVKKILLGNVSSVIEKLQQEKEEAVRKLEFEKAHLLKTRIETLTSLQFQNTVQMPLPINYDVVGYANDASVCCLVYMRFSEGKLIYTRSIVTLNNFSDVREMVESGLFNVLHQSHIPEVIIARVNMETGGIVLREPREPEEMQILLLAEENAKTKLQSYSARVITEEENIRALSKIKELFSLGKEPEHIEAFDNSNLGAIERTSACVVFLHGMPARKLWRYYRIKGEDVKSDIDALREVLTRRYQRLLNEGTALPDLIVIDGGKTHLSVALEVLSSLGIDKKVFPVAFAKGKGNEIIYSTIHPSGLVLDKGSEEFKFLRRLINEAHNWCRKLLHKRNRVKKNKLI